MIYHIEEIDRIREVEKEVAQKTGAPVFDISHWNSGYDYKNYLYQYLKIPDSNKVFNYIYGYEFPESVHLQIRKVLNIDDQDFSSVLLPSSTLAIVNIANFLQKNSINNICVLQPSYFTVTPCLQSFGLNVINVGVLYEDGVFTIPIDEVLAFNPDAVWITNPVFCTNIGFQKSELEKLNLLLKNKIYLICDESLAPLGTELNPRLNNNEYLLSIHSPHKVLGTNAMKFACIITHQKHIDFFNIWTDLLAGGMALSSSMAITHFLSDNYKFCLKKSMDYIYRNYVAMKDLLKLHQKSCSYTHVCGIYITIFFPAVPFQLSTRHSFIKELIENTNVSLLPGYLEGYLENLGFCFRINLTLNRTLLLHSLNKVLMYLEKEYL